jgi:transcriptional regulator with XRE-family HTH domain
MLGLRLRQLAASTGLTIATLSEIETGVNLSPYPGTLKKLAAGLGLPISDLYLAVDWLPAGELPTLRPYLRAKYGDLDEGDLADIEAYANRRVQRHGGSGPIGREDEQP